MAIKIIELKPIKESSEDFETMEKRLKKLFRELIYLPILSELGETKRVIENSGDEYDALRSALMSGRVMFSQGTFSGKFNAGISKILKSIGAKFDRKTGTFKIRQSDLPDEVKSSIWASESWFSEKLSRIDRTLEKLLPDEIADRFKCADLFDKTLWKTDKEFASSVKGIAVPPQLTPERRKRIASEWQDNMKLYIKDFTREQIPELRKMLQKSSFAGNRYESVIGTIKKSYETSEKKAKFLARQETSLLMTKFKEVRYTDAGVHEYKWGCVAGSPLHPVRKSHRDLGDASKAGKIFRWDDPPITTAPGEPARRNNPGQDFNCRCFAKPIVKYRG